MVDHIDTCTPHRYDILIRPKIKELLKKIDFTSTNIPYVPKSPEMFIVVHQPPYLHGGLIDSITLKLNLKSWTLDVQNGKSTYDNEYTGANEKHSHDLRIVENIILRLFAYKPVYNLFSVTTPKNFTLILMDTSSHNIVVDHHASYYRFPYFPHTTFPQIHQIMSEHGLTVNAENTQLIRKSEDSDDIIAIVKSRDIDILSFLRNIFDRARLSVQPLSTLHTWAAKLNPIFSETSAKYLMDLFNIIDIGEASAAPRIAERPLRIVERPPPPQKININLVLVGSPVPGTCGYVMAQNRVFQGQTFDGAPMIRDTTMADLKKMLEIHSGTELTSMNSKEGRNYGDYFLIFKCDAKRFFPIFHHIKDLIPEEDRKQLKHVRFEEFYEKASTRQDISIRLAEVVISNIRGDGSLR